MFGVIMPLCNRMFCCIFGWYFYIEIRLKYEKKIFCCPALELFHCLPLWTTVRLHGKKATKCNKTGFFFSSCCCSTLIAKFMSHLRLLSFELERVIMSDVIQAESFWAKLKFFQFDQFFYKYKFCEEGTSRFLQCGPSMTSWVDPYPFNGMVRLNKRVWIDSILKVWIDSRCHWWSTL